MDFAIAIFEELLFSMGLLVAMYLMWCWPFHRGHVFCDDGSLDRRYRKGVIKTVVLCVVLSANAAFVCYRLDSLNNELSVLPMEPQPRGWRFSPRFSRFMYFSRKGIFEDRELTEAEQQELNNMNARVDKTNLMHNYAKFAGGIYEYVTYTALLVLAMFSFVPVRFWYKLPLILLLPLHVYCFHVVTKLRIPDALAGD